MHVNLLSTGQYLLRRFWNTILLTGMLGLFAIVYSMVNIVRERAGGEEWILGVGFCLLMGSATASMVYGVLVNYGVRIQALEQRTAAKNETAPA